MLGQNFRREDFVRTPTGKIGVFVCYLKDDCREAVVSVDEELLIFRSFRLTLISPAEIPADEQD
jgi:hypothetical protein